MRLWGRACCVFATPNRGNVNTNSNGFILEHMTCSTTRFSVPMVTNGFSLCCSKVCGRCGVHTYLCVHLTLSNRGLHNCSFFSPLWTSIYTQTQEEHTHTAQGADTAGMNGVALILAHVKISTQSPPPPSHVFLRPTLIPSLWAGLPGWRGEAPALPSTGQKWHWDAEKGGWGYMWLLVSQINSTANLGLRVIYDGTG